MAQFQEAVLEYLKSYRPDEYAQLKRERRNELVEQLYEERDRVLPRVQEQYGISKEQATVLADGVALRTILPVP